MVDRKIKGVRFSLNNMAKGFEYAKKLGYQGSLNDIQNASDMIFNEDGTINPRGKFLSCKKCGGGIGVCTKGSCIGGTCCPPKLTIKIPI